MGNVLGADTAEVRQLVRQFSANRGFAIRTTQVACKLLCSPEWMGCAGQSRCRRSGLAFLPIRPYHARAPRSAGAFFAWTQ